VTPLVPLVLFGWLFLSISFFLHTTPQRAAVLTVFGGLLFLPVASFNLPGIPTYDKFTAIAIGLILGETLSGEIRRNPLRLERADVPMMLWCFVSPVATSLANGLGLYNGVSGVLENVCNWGVFYWIGRRFFGEPSSLRLLTRGVIIGGLIYFPLVLYEVRMSPQLNVHLYGFFAHDFFAHMRYGGFRPIVFMHSGLMVALWMSVSATASFWMWRTNTIQKIGGIPMGAIAVLLMGATVLCKSANGIVFMALGVGSGLYFVKFRSTRKLRWLVLVIPLYIALRLTDVISIEQVRTFAARIFDSDRVDSLEWRLLQENLFGQKAKERPLLGWGGYNRGWPVNPETGAQLIQMVDSLWVILFSTFGYLGLISVFLAMGLGPWRALAAYLRSRKENRPKGLPFATDAVVLSLIVTFFLIDSLLNAMTTPVYVLCAGALVSYTLTIDRPRALAGAA